MTQRISHAIEFYDNLQTMFEGPRNGHTLVLLVRQDTHKMVAYLSVDIFD